MCEPKAAALPVTGKTYGWTSSRGGAANSCFIDDPDLKPPLRLKWAARSYGHFKTTCVATAEGDLLSLTLERTLTCLEQATGRMRWRMRLSPGGEERRSSAGMLVDGGRLYVPCPSSGPQGGQLLCLDLKDGRILWSAEIRSRDLWARGCPLAVAGKVVFPYVKQGAPPSTRVEAWDAVNGQSAWQVEINVSSASGARAEGCSSDGVVYFTAGNEAWGWQPEGGRKRGETLAIDVADGRILWRNNEIFGSSYPLESGDGLLLTEKSVGLRCVSTRDGTLRWKGGDAYMTGHSLGPDYVIARGYGGAGRKFKLEDGKPYPGGGEFGGDTHACSSVALTPCQRRPESAVFPPV